MKEFIGEDFLLPNESARRLFHDYAAGMPIIDFHCHLPPAEIANDAMYPSIAQAWLGGDHYKWRAMRANGIPEADITGHAPDYATFLAWARTLPRLVGNPLYHWAHLELRRYFGLGELLSEKTAPLVWEACNAALAKPEFGARGLLKQMKVRAVCTTDDPADSLEHHKAYAAWRAANPGASDPVMAPTFRPDKAMAVEDPAAWNAYIARLEAASGVSIQGWDGLEKALERRHEAFHQAGCRASDHALVQPLAEFSPEEELERIVIALRGGKAVPQAEADKLKTAVLLLVGRLDAKRGWAMQLHMASIRNLNSRMFAKLGPDTGYDAAGDSARGRALGLFMDALEAAGALPKVVLYSLNPNDYDLLATIMGCFQDGQTPGKMQLGSSWWFNDHIDGMTRQVRTLANIGLLSRFVGMLTDSRSFLSFPRHEYFRRILCGILGTWIEEGEAPADFGLMGGMVRDISFRNAFEYFRIPGVAE
jgi:glucuronate isomerase